MSAPIVLMACILSCAIPVGLLLWPIISSTVGAINSTLKAANNAPAPKAVKIAVVFAFGLKTKPAMAPKGRDIVTRAPIRKAHKAYFAVGWRKGIVISVFCKERYAIIIETMANKRANSTFFVNIFFKSNDYQFNHKIIFMK